MNIGFESNSFLKNLGGNCADGNALAGQTVLTSPAECNGTDMGAGDAGAFPIVAAVNWCRVLTRGAALAIVATVHLVLFVWLLMPPGRDRYTHMGRGRGPAFCGSACCSHPPLNTPLSTYRACQPSASRVSCQHTQGNQRTARVRRARRG